MQKPNLNVVISLITALIISTFFITSSNDSITVNGTCLKKVKKDMFELNVSVKNLKKNPSDASKASVQTYNVLSKYFSLLQEKNPTLEFETTEYTTHEKKEWNENYKKQVTLGIESIITLSVKTENSDLLSVIAGEISKYKDVYTNSFSSFVSKKLLKQEQENCIKDATVNAKIKAEKIAKSVNQSIGDLIKAELLSNSNNSFRYAKSLSSAGFSEAENYDEMILSPQIFTGTEEISVKITAEFELN